MIRVLLVDDHTVVRECLAAALGSSSDVRVVGEAGDGITAIELAMSLRPDVAVIDITMPGLSGVEVARRLHANLPQTRVLVLTMHERRCWRRKSVTRARHPRVPTAHCQLASAKCFTWSLKA